MQRQDKPTRQFTEQSANSAQIDTSLLYEEFRRQFNMSAQPLSTDFRALVSWIKVGDQRTHLIHSYPAKLLSHIAHFFINASVLTRQGAKVLDPFCGSGTVALEASMSGCQPLVADANPMARLLTRVKTTPYCTDDLLAEATAIIRRARRYKTAPSVDIVNSQLWYSEERKRQLEILLRAISEIADEKVRDFFLVCFSSAAKKLSYADPAISVPVRLKKKPSRPDSINARIDDLIEKIESADHLEEFANICLNNIQRISRTNKEFPERSAAKLVGTDARNLIDGEGERLPSNSVDLVITSPPYGSAQKYVRSMSLSLNWLGLATPKQLTKIEQQTIGREHLHSVQSEWERSNKLDGSFEKFLKTISDVNPRRARINRIYLLELRTSLAEISRVVAPEGHAVIVVGNNTVCGHIMYTDKFICKVMLGFGMSLQLHLTDHIKSRGLLTKRNGGRAAISRESILVFRKGK